MSETHIRQSNLLQEEPWGERHFPIGLTENAPERSTSWTARAGWQVRLYPWRAVGIATGFGLILGMLAAKSRCACKRE